MEKDKKGLFDRLLDFWKEKLGVHESDRIGFWNEAKDFGNHFAEMGAVVSLTQEETKKTFWEETAKTVLEDKRSDFFPAGEEERKRMLPEEEMETAEDSKKGSKLFTAEIFRVKQEEDTAEKGEGNPFLWEMPDRGREKRRIVPVAEEKSEESVLNEAEPVMTERISEKQTEKQAEPVVDIEILMRQMTRKLWEERESCGRRLR